MINDSNIAPAITSESNPGVSTPVESNQAPVSSSSQPEATQAEINTSVDVKPGPTANEQAQQSKRLYEREEVNRIARHAAEEREVRVRNEYERNKQYSTPQAFQPQQSQAQIPIEVTRQHIQQLAVEERMVMEADSLRMKVNDAQGKYNDYATVVNVLDDLVTDHTAPVFNSIENAGEVIYELGKHPERIPSVLSDLATDPFNPYKALRAKRALQTISQQLKANEAAKNQPLPKEPLQHEKPTTAAMDSGKVTVADLRKMKKYQT